MEQVLSMVYLWLKAGHLIFVIFWMAGLFMLPRYYVYHQEAAEDSPENALWLDRENKLRKIILLPSVVIVWVLGLALAYAGDWWTSGWFHAKLLLVVLLSAFHGWLVAYGKKLARGERTLSGKKLRLLNEVPGITIAIIVILVVVKPF
ncbi:membrane protein [Novosphingobium marinum]|uniref:Protoporphyrinogen IX oxidase n=1 Tax=Novosphingobium marinum TaxID=1514948 RepID=A0A7Z0BUY1_9SPHN|nr:CopD family protein [Novosphingobium marinum]NYH95643.1 putative membrane protein [Novosphingobium marinum]GGC28667.1 membrane protein [Novosphingobium marinum]